jgi:hypothetical protein
VTNEDYRSSIENTSQRDPLSHFVGFLDRSDAYITDMEADGQKQVVHSTMLPTELHGGAEDDLTALGFTLGPVNPDDDLFREATLPDGWERRATDHSMWSEIVDTHGRPRVKIFYKAAFYDRKASMRLQSVESYAYDVVDGAPLVLDDEWATAEAMRAALLAKRERDAEYVASSRVDDDGYWTGKVARTDELLASLSGGAS